MGIELFAGSSNISGHQILSFEEAKKRGLISPGGILAILGELDYFRLIERLTRAPITDKQLITPFRYYLLSKGVAVASLMCLCVLLLRFVVLLLGENLNYVLKFSTFLTLRSLIFYGTALPIIGYVYYPQGVVYTAVRYTLFGYGLGICVIETITACFLILSLLFKPFVAEHLWLKSKIGDFFLGLWYNAFVGSIYEEILSLVLVYITIFAAFLRLYFYIERVAKRHLDTKKPYALEGEKGNLGVT